MQDEETLSIFLGDDWLPYTRFTAVLGQGWVEFVCTDVTVTQKEALKTFIIKGIHGLLTFQLKLL